MLYVAGFSGAILTALFLALVARELELTTQQKYLARFVDLHAVGKTIQKDSANIIQECTLDLFYRIFKNSFI